jgi:hypothetical protein
MMKNDEKIEEVGGGKRMVMNGKMKDEKDKEVRKLR